MGQGEGRERRLVGRGPEWAAARQALKAGRSGVVFTGPPGVGKSSLARAVAEELARREEADSVWIVGTSAQPPIPFGAFAPLAPELGAKPGRQPDPLHLLQSFRTAVVRRSRLRPLVLVVDDAHRLDEHSATLLLQLVANEGLKVVMAMQSGRPGPEAVRSLWKDELIERVDLGPLDRSHIGELIAQVLSELLQTPEGDLAGTNEAPVSHPLGGELAEAVWMLSAGNPLYARELVLASHRAGRVALREGVWRLTGELALGPRLRERIADWLTPLSRPEREVLELLAWADPLPLRVLLKMVDTDPLETLTMAGLTKFEWGRGEQVARAGHPLVSELIRRTIPPTRAAAAAGRLADAFEQDGRLEADVLRVVPWRLASGSVPEPSLLLQASRRAAEQRHWRQSEGLARIALDHGAGPDARMAVVDALQAMGLNREALSVLEAGGPASSEDDPAHRAAAHAHLVFLTTGQLEEALAILEAARAGISDPSDSAWLNVVGAGLHSFAGFPAEALEQVGPVLSRPGLEPRVEATARAVMSLALSLTGRCEAALEVLDGSDARVRATPASFGWGPAARGIAYRAASRIESLQRMATTRYEQAARLQDHQDQGMAAASLAWAALMEGRLHPAIARYREAAAANGPADSLAMRMPALLGLAEALALAGDVDGAGSFLEQTRPVAERSLLVMSSWSIASAWLAAANGMMSEALDQLAASAAAARQHHQTWWELQALHSVVRLGSSTPAGRLAELSTWVEGPLVGVAAAHAVALAGGDGAGDALDQVSQRYADAGLLLFAAEAAAQACRAHQASGQSRRATASAARGHMLVGSADDGPPPVGLALALTPPELTRREREVAMLAARGLPSQTIANRLCLSVRTVDTHLARVYSKLGISGRSELAVALVSGAVGRDHVEAG